MTKETFVKAKRTGPTEGVFVHGLIYDLPATAVTGSGWEVLNAEKPAKERVTEPAPAAPAKKGRK